jgi:hypothetical protein
MPRPDTQPAVAGPLLHWQSSGESFFDEAAEGAGANPRTLRQKD